MALIKCPGCGGTVSDKAKKCPHCSYIFADENNIVCTECGYAYDADLEACPQCGCPKSVKPKKSSAWKYNLIIVSVILVALIIIGTVLFVVFKNRKESDYYEKMGKVTYMMLDGAANAEKAGNLIKGVWTNSIYQNRDEETDRFTMENGRFLDDFNDALAKLSADKEFSSDIDKLMENENEVTAVIKTMKDPPAKYEQAFCQLKVFYENYKELMDLAICPSGSLNDFNDDFTKYDKATVDEFERMRWYLD